ncbi:restriction endonuclease subunit S [Labilibaculum manganireducens]|uniref:restriction endonuclease subunit S n=1 Tax=Labilibaculum manganireducens TaxID=1940525 RepID=UPI0029F467A5|nr:restriction endonuclease subunit S [Labilibaculum manganireducens]
MKKYDKYKKCSIDWISEIPENWNTLKLGRSFSNIGSGTTPKSTNPEYYENGQTNWLNTGDLNDSYINETSKKITQLALKDHSTLKEYPVDSIVIALYGATIGKLGHLKMPTTTNQACCVISESVKISQRFLFYYFLAAREYIISKSYGGGQPNISQDLIRQLYIPAPSSSEQKTIINYLEHLTTQIDTLIEKKELLIEKLKRQRQAIINEAVTKGLNPVTPMKNSGIEWMGEIPEHWVFNKMKRNTYMKGRIGWQGLKQEEFIDEGPYLITGMNFKDGIIRWEEVYHITQERYEQAPEIQLKKGDVLMTKDGTIGKLLYVDYLPGQASLNSHLLVLRCLDGTYLPKFLYYQLMTDLFQEHIDLHKTGTTFFGITQEAVGKYQMLLPPIIEQDEIIKYIEEKNSLFDELIFKSESSIEKLKLYRQSIISEAVTGKIDLRDWKQTINN